MSSTLGQLEWWGSVIFNVQLACEKDMTVSVNTNTLFYPKPALCVMILFQCNSSRIKIINFELDWLAFPRRISINFVVLNLEMSWRELVYTDFEHWYKKLNYLSKNMH